MATTKSQMERMLSGELYVADDPELYACHLRAQELLARFNATPAETSGERRSAAAEGVAGGHRSHS